MKTDFENHKQTETMLSARVRCLVGFEVERERLMERRGRGSSWFLGTDEGKAEEGRSYACQGEEEEVHNILLTRRVLHIHPRTPCVPRQFPEH